VTVADGIHVSLVGIRYFILGWYLCVWLELELLMALGLHSFLLLLLFFSTIESVSNQLPIRSLITYTMDRLKYDEAEPTQHNGHPAYLDYDRLVDVADAFIHSSG
jgi:hypothetical protein